MSAINTLNVVTEAMTQALEKMAFMMIMPFDEEPEVPHVVIMSEINFSGPISGTLRAAAGIEFAQVLAENISSQAELTEEECIDAMKELVNVTCGLVLPMIAASGADVFDLTVPHLTRHEDRLHWDDFVSQDDVTVLNVEGYPLATRLILHGE